MPLTAGRSPSSPFAILQEAFDISRAVQHGQDGERHAHEVVHDEVGVNAPELTGLAVRSSRVWPIPGLSASLRAAS